MESKLIANQYAFKAMELERKHKLHHLPDSWSSSIEKQKQEVHQIKLIDSNSHIKSKGVFINNNSLETLDNRNEEEIDCSH